MNLKIYQVDAFTKAPFRGNPAAVCFLPEEGGPTEDSWMAAVAREMNLSETAFLRPQEDGWSLRWFTPAAEVALCGHATLASAHLLFELGLVDPHQQARFHTLSGLLTAEQDGQEIVLDFPATPAQAVDPIPGLSKALGLELVFQGKSAFDYLVRVGTEAEVRGAKPDFAALEQCGARAVILTAAGEGGEFDFISRTFAPGVGINEDPVTGSAHCALGPYWGEILGKKELLGYQASSRGGVIRVTLEGERVKLGGHAVTILAGELIGF